ncbi:MAG: hypothetical protein HYZ37_12430 [Candidatus Solibacter usitatus]|nr:hypothetical protein [Candidatus Solibacter usitatus]
MRWRAVRIFCLTLGLLILASFPWGPLFAWSPWKPGYRHFPAQWTDVYIPDGFRKKPAYDQLDRYLREGESYLRLPAKKRIVVVLCPDWQHFQRYALVAGKGVGAVAIATGTAIYVSPKLDEKGLDHGEFLKHEMAHALIHQHQNVAAAYAFAKVEWLAEGIAVSFGDQKSYVTQETFLQRARTEELLPVIDPALRSPTYDMRFSYIAWKNFVEFLMREDRDVFQKYLEATMRRPANWRELFQQTYGNTFAAAVARFQERLRN